MQHRLSSRPMEHPRRRIRAPLAELPRVSAPMESEEATRFRHQPPPRASRMPLATRWNALRILTVTTPSPSASSPAVATRMRRTPRRDNPLEWSIRRLVFAQGLRYRVDARPEMTLLRRADLLFRNARVAVFVDGCFWHVCPRHATWPKANAAWWRRKLLGNEARDRDTDRRLRSAGWRVVRVWEHEDPVRAAARIVRVVRSRLALVRACAPGARAVRRGTRPGS